MATGRTPSRFVKVQIEDSGGTLRDIPVRTIGDVGIAYEEVDLSALQEALKGFMSNQGTFALTITGPFDNKAATTASGSGQAAASYMSGSHTVLQPLNGGLTPRAFAVYYGIQNHWSTGDPVFGADNCVIVTSYTVNESGLYSAKIAKVAGGTDPAWGTSAITVA